MAGELEHIIPSHPSVPGWKASRTQSIVYVDPNGVTHNIISVYWSPTNAISDVKLIWSTGSLKSITTEKMALAEWVCPSEWNNTDNLEVTMWLDKDIRESAGSFRAITFMERNGNNFNIIRGLKIWDYEISIKHENFIIGGREITFYKTKVILSGITTMQTPINLVGGQTYYIGISNMYDSNNPSVPLVEAALGERIQGNYLTYNDNNSYLNDGSSHTNVSVTSHSDSKVKCEITSDKLVQGDRTVAIEYIPSENITLQKLEMFVTGGNNVSQTNIRLTIFHESGIPLVSSNVCASQNGYMYGINGQVKTCTTFNNYLLYGGQKYYIVLEGQNAGDFYPAYFQGKNGNYKDFSCNYDYTNDCKYYIAEPGPTPKYYGNLDTSMPIFGLESGRWFMWLNGYGAGLSKWFLYRRTNVGSQYQFQGIIGDSPDNQTNFEYRHAVQLIEKGPTGDFIWYCQDSPHVMLSSGTIYTKQQAGSVQYTSNNTIAVDVNGDDTNERLVAIANVFKGLTQKPYVITAGGNTHYKVMRGYLFSLKSGYTNGFTDEPLTELPANPQSNCIYYLSNTISGIDYTGAYLYNGSWNLLTFGNDDINISGIITECLDIKTVDTVLTKVGANSEFLESVKDTNNNDISVPHSLQSFFLNGETTVPMKTDRKYYLKINGTEI